MSTQIHYDLAASIGKVHLQVTDLPASLAFYQNVIGFQVLEQTDNKAMLTADGENVLLTIEQPDPVYPKQGRTTGLYHFAILLPSRKDLAKALIHLLEERYPLQGASDHQFSEAIYLADPDGNGIEIYADRLRKLWEYQNGFLTAVTDPLDAENLLQEADDTPWSALPAGTVIGHIHLHESDLDKARTFYHQGLGMTITLTIGGHALFVSAGGYHHHVGLNTWNGKRIAAPNPQSVGLVHYSIQFEDEASLKRSLEGLENIGVTPVREQGSLWITDPFGHKIKLLKKEKH